MATKTSFVCDCCTREADSNVGWAKVTVAADEEITAAQQHDLCEICWSPLDVLMQKVSADARDQQVEKH